MRYLLHRTIVTMIALALVFGSFSSTRRAAAHPVAGPAARYFKETGHNITGAIKTFYEARGDVAIFGLPLTEVIVENGRQVQYFERARFELHPELPNAYFVSLTHLGRQLTRGRTGGPFAPAAPRGQPSAYFRETAHNVGPTFFAFWNQRGGLPVFGYPLSEPFEEASPTDGVVRLVQYFERARFEYRPEASPASQVQLGLLGRQLLDRSGVPASARKPAPAITLLGEATTGYFGSLEERVKNIAVAAARMNGMVVQPGQIFSFNDALGGAGTAAGFVEGYAVVNGRLEKVPGGGICQVSTTMYRAVFNAGLDVVERRSHSVSINFYENVPGWDATVFAPYTDFKWRNDTSGPVYIVATSDPSKATVTFALYGYPDGRETTMVGPTISNRTAPGKPFWQFDPTVPRGQTRQLVSGRPGMEVAMRRVVTAADGRILHNDTLPSKYKPWEDFFLYGPGVTPPKGVNIIPPTTRSAAPISP